MNYMRIFFETHEEIVRFNVSVHEGSVVDVPKPFHQLTYQHQSRFQAKLSLAVIKQILEGRSQYVNHHVVVLPF